MERVLILADDLTGALDSACAFAARGLSTQVVLRLEDLGAAVADPTIQVVAYVSASREVPAAQAAAVVSRICNVIQGFDGIIFKKIDSRLKGNIGAELAPLAQLFPRRILACPAIPSQGRQVVGQAIAGTGIPHPIAIASVLGLPAEIPDCATDEDIDRILPGRISENLYVGAAGLAGAIARRLAPAISMCSLNLPRPLLLAIGSRDPITLAQIAAASVPAQLAPNGVVPDLNLAPEVLVQLAAGNEVIDGATAADRFAVGVAEQLDRLRARALFACGGETAYVIMRVLGCTRLDLRGEVLPGVPVAYCPARNLTILTKSGGFGGPDLLLELLRKFDKSAPQGVTTL